MEVKIKKLREGFKIIERQTKGAVGYDMYVPQDTLVPRGRSIIPMGFAIELPEYIEGKIDARSGFNAKAFEGATIQKIKTGNTIDCFKKLKGGHRFDCDVLEGDVDWDYRKEVGVVVKNNDVPFIAEAGTRIAQMKFYKVEIPDLIETDTLSETDRKGGYNSTGTH